MAAVVFTYYTSDLSETFLDNVYSLLAHSQQSYDSLVILTIDPIPNTIVDKLKQVINIIRPYHSKRIQDTEDSFKNRKFWIPAFVSEAISYNYADIVTVFDPNLFIVNSVPAFDGLNLFYKNQTGFISPALLTVNPRSLQRLVNLIDNLNPADQMSIRLFNYLIVNNQSLGSYLVSQSQFILSNGSDSDPIIQSKLIAVDTCKFATSQGCYERINKFVKDLIPKEDSFDLNRLKIQHFSSIQANPYYRILFKYTSRSRPDLFYRGLKSIIDNCESQNFVILCSLDLDDPTLPKYKEVLSNFSEKVVKANYGYSKNKIDAINRDLNEYSGRWDILVNMSDDMVFIQSGFDQIIRKTFGEDLDRFVHFNDGLNFSRLASMTIEGRPYYERFNYIYHPSYQSLWCDNEAQDVAKILGRYKYAGNNVAILRHLHPSAGLAEFDEQYRKTEDRQVFSIDHSTYQTRKKNGFDPNKIISRKKKPIFSILIATLESRKQLFYSLLEKFNHQINEYDGLCEILWESDDGSKKTGEKRNSLLSRADGKYLAFFDDDDEPSPNYIKLVLEAIKSEPDCCSLLGQITVDGQNPQLFEHSLKYSDWRTNETGKIRYERNPNHLNVIKSDIAKAISFPEIDYGEDKAWSDRLKQSNLLKTESKINDILYYYKFLSKK
jgi:hypothetical protein